MDANRCGAHDAGDEPFTGCRRCCFYWIQPSWQQIRLGADGQPLPHGISSVWRRAVGALMKVREWSELVAGPRWKTFIRRFNRHARQGGGGTGGGGGGGGFGSSRFQYDPLSYALNFDEGHGASPETEYARQRTFSGRFATATPSLTTTTAEIGAKDLSPLLPVSVGGSGRKVTFADGVGPRSATATLLEQKT